MKRNTFKKNTEPDRLCNDYFLIKNPEIKVYDYRDKFNMNLGISNLAVCLLKGYYRIGLSDYQWRYQESLLLGKKDIEDEHSTQLEGLFEGIKVTGHDLQLQPESLIAIFLTEHPFNYE